MAIWGEIEAAWHGKAASEALREPGTPPVSFGRLRALSEQAARGLIEHLAQGRERGRIVAVALPSSVGLAVAYLAVLRAGMVFMPLPDVPDAAAQAAAAKVAVVIVPSCRAGGAGSVTVDALVHAGASASHALTEDMSKSAQHLVRSSGSSGTPRYALCDQRGSLLSHGFRNTWLPHRPDDVTGVHLFGIWDLLSALLAGRCAAMLPSTAQLTRDALATGVTRLMLSPSLLAGLLTSGKPLLDQLRVLTLCGEPAGESLVAQARARMRPDAVIVDLYSLSETHDVAVGIRLPGLRALTPLPSVKLQVDAATGELLVGGPHIAVDEYMGEARAFSESPDGTRWFRTGDRARLDPDTGALELDGRLNDATEVKVRGSKVDLHEVRRAVMQLPGVRDCQALPVSLQRHAERCDELVAFVVAEPAPAVEGGQKTTTLEDDWRRQLDGLQAQSVPTHWLRLDKLPVKPDNGKLDRQALREIALERLATALAPQPKVEMEEEGALKMLCQRFAAAAGRETMAPDDDLFDSGGHSLSAMRLAGELGVELADLLLHATPRAMQAVMLARRLERSPRAVSRTSSCSSSAFSACLARLEKEVVALGDQHQERQERQERKQLAVLVTGASGLVGSHVVAALERDPDVRLVLAATSLAPDREALRRAARQHGATSPLSPDAVRLVGRDMIADGKQHCRVHAVVHCAGKVDRFARFAALEEANVRSLERVVARCARDGAALVHISSSAAVPPPADGQAVDGVIPSDWQSRASGDAWSSRKYGRAYRGYGQSKWAAERLAQLAEQRLRLPVAVLRPSEVFCRGKSMLFEALAWSVAELAALPRLPAAAHVTWSDVEGLAREAVDAAIGGRGGGVRNVASGHVNLCELCEALCEAAGLERLELSDWESLLRRNLAAKDSRWTMLLDAPWGLHGLLGMCEPTLDLLP